MEPLGMELNFLNMQEVEEIVNAFMNVPRKSEEKNSYVFEGGVPLTESFYNLPETLKYVQRFEDYLKPIYGDNMVFANTFTRLYKRNSFLRIHTDREGLDVTVSLGLRRDVPWTISVSHIPIGPDWSNESKYDKTDWFRHYTSYDLYPGDFAHCYGRKNPHWRPTLECEEGQCNIYAFFHWTLK